MQPRTQIGPLTPTCGSSTNPMDRLSSGSSAFPVFLSQTTRRPEGQSPASSMTIFLAFGLSDCGVSIQIPPARWQKRAEAHRSSASVSFRAGPLISLAWSMIGFSAGCFGAVKLDFYVCSIAKRFVLRLPTTAKSAVLL